MPVGEQKPEVLAKKKTALNEKWEVTLPLTGLTFKQQLVL